MTPMLIRITRITLQMIKTLNVFKPVCKHIIESGVANNSKQLSGQCYVHARLKGIKPLLYQKMSFHVASNCMS